MVVDRYVNYLLIWVMSNVAVPAFAQRTVQGTVKEKDTGLGAVGVNVLLRSQPRSGMLGFGAVAEDGSYSISTTSQADTLYLVVSGFNVVSKTKTWVKGHDRVDFTVAYSEQEIKESRVQAGPVKRSHDTLTYYVSQYRDSVDRSIGDVLQKIPGIIVTASGGIMYKGDGINKFYVEGLDMLGDKYGIATNNIRAEDIAAIEVLEDHQPIKVLENWVESDKAAINLRLKESARGIWSGTVGLEGGYAPAMFDLQATPMMFSRKFQTIMTYKGNNTGVNVTDELSSQYGSIIPLAQRLSVISPSVPPVTEQTWRRNTTHALSANAIVKTGDYSDFTVRAHYIHDRNLADGLLSTTYHLPGQSEVGIRELTSRQSEYDNVNVDLILKQNTSKIWLIDELTMDFRKDKTHGMVENEDGSVNQDHHSPSVVINNKVESNKSFGKTLLMFSSNSDYTRRDEALEAMPYIQEVSADRLRTRNRLSTTVRIRRTDLSLNGEVNADIEKFKSYLSDTDSTRNDVRWKEYELRLTPSWMYKPFDGLSLQFSTPVSMKSISSKNRVSAGEFDRRYLVVHPDIYARWRLNYKWSLNADANRYTSFSGISDAYDGVIMRNYRTFSSGSIHENRTDNSNAQISLRYSDVMTGLTSEVGGTVWKSTSQLSSGTVMAGNVIRTVTYDMPNTSSGYRLNASVGGRSQKLSTTARISFGWDASRYEYYSQGVLIPTDVKRLSVKSYLNSNIRNRAVLLYQGTISRDRLSSQTMDAKPVLTIQQGATLNIILGSHTIWSVNGSHYYNDRLSGDDTNMLFMNSSVSYKTGRTEVILEGNNLFNTSRYRTESESGIMAQAYEYSLRPRSVLLKILFSIR